MKARIDTKAKTLAIEEAVSMDYLLKSVKFVAGDDWKARKAETSLKFEVASPPIIIRDHSRQQPQQYRNGIDVPIIVAPSIECANAARRIH